MPANTARAAPLPPAMAPNLHQPASPSPAMSAAAGPAALQQGGFEPPTQRRFIAPPSSETRQQAEQRRARLRALRGVLQLREFPSDSDITIYEAAPLTPYELHTRHQSRNQRVKFVQTGDDDRSMATQTEEIETAELGAQWPDDGAAPGMGGGSLGSDLSASESAKTSSLLTANVGRLRRFLLGAGQAVETLCTENLMEATGGSGGFVEANSLPFSQKHTRLELPAAFGERPPTDLSFDASGASLLAAFGKYRAIEQDVWQEVTDDLARGRLQVSELSSAEVPETFVLHPSTERAGSSDGGQL